MVAWTIGELWENDWDRECNGKVGAAAGLSELGGRRVSCGSVSTGEVFRCLVDGRAEWRRGWGSLRKASHPVDERQVAGGRRAWCGWPV